MLLFTAFYSSENPEKNSFHKNINKQHNCLQQG